jgi:hypothetical protein
VQAVTAFGEDVVIPDAFDMNQRATPRAVGVMRQGGEWYGLEVGHDRYAVSQPVAYLPSSHMSRSSN